MGIKQKLQKAFSTRTETSETHPDETLRTHYYKAMKEKVFQELEAIFSSRQGYDISSISEEHGEMIVKTTRGKKTFIVVTVIMVRPYKTAVDFSINTDTAMISDFGYSAKLARELYEEVNKRLTFVGTGLGSE
ncbi:DUF1499 domain-containing protein [Alkalicoccus urumqiensis]|uniref:DUF1499 domain-containing protein n=1 Tax=Alkalicoccus urumqiensis TaxID=1548213 RepID=A0A2P6MDF3_ALKUR|nr:DUF1499 domain-containing protein [Alkalicoccus urumqiensis]PRO64306.1 DUF1499 domain-containing protein [Alkalicoccus urumqiensis]